MAFLIFSYFLLKIYIQPIIPLNAVTINIKVYIYICAKK